MTNPNPWLEYLTLLDGPFECVPQPHWSHEVRGQYLEQGLVRETMPLDSVSCDCDSGPICDVIWCDRNGNRRPIRCCPHCGPTEIPISDLAQWQVSPTGLLSWLSRLLALHGTPESLVTDHLWRIGRVGGNQPPVTVFFGRSLRSCSATAVIERLAQSRAVLLVPCQTPDWAVPCPVIPLDTLIRWEGTSWSVQADMLAPAPRSRVCRRAPVRKQGQRLAVVQDLREELAQHVRAARDHAQAARDHGRAVTLLPCPTRSDLAKRCRSSSATVSRCFAQDEELRRMWDLANDLEAITRLLDR